MKNFFLEEYVRNFYNKQIFLAPTDIVLIALSGGVDSVVLADISLKVLGSLKVKLAYYNHRIRSLKEQKQELTVIKKLAKFWKTDIIYGEPNIDLCSVAQKENKSLEELARDYRYTFLKKLKSKLQVTYIATAHHQLDQAETFLIRLLQKSSWQSLRGIRQKREDFVIRPLLNLPKHSILEYQQKNSLIFWEDTTNKESIFRRNSLRNQIFPLIKKNFPDCIGALCDWQMRICETLDWVERFIPAWDKEDDFLRISSSDFFSIPISFQREVISRGFRILRPKVNLSRKFLNTFPDNLKKKKNSHLLLKGHGLILEEKNLWIILRPVLHKRNEMS